MTDPSASTGPLTAVERPALTRPLAVAEPAALIALDAVRVSG